VQSVRSRQIYRCGSRGRPRSRRETILRLPCWVFVTPSTSPVPAMANVTTIDIDGGASRRQIGTACDWVKPRVFGLKRNSSRSIRVPVHGEVIFAIWIESAGRFDAWVPYGVIAEKLTPSHSPRRRGRHLTNPRKGVIPSRPDVGRQGQMGEQVPIGFRLEGQVNGEWELDRLGELRLRTAS
jgi:hypothetical protein